MSQAAQATPVHNIVDRSQAAVLLQHPLRPRILAAAREPISATRIAARVGESRQKVNYHVGQLAAAGLLIAVDRVRRRNMMEHRFIASAQGYVIAPQVLAGAAVNDSSLRDALSATHLVVLAARVQAEVTDVMASAQARGKRVATMSLDVDLSFSSAQRRSLFASALTEAVRNLVEEYASSAEEGSRSRAASRRFRLMLGLYPRPATTLSTED